jgi:hypothetical protein
MKVVNPACGRQALIQTLFIKKRILSTKNTTNMKRNFRLIMALVSLFTLVMILPVSGQAPPPPSHSQNGNQTSPGGTGCPVDRTQSILIALALSLGYAGFALYLRGSKEVAKK